LTRPLSSHRELIAKKLGRHFAAATPWPAYSYRCRQGPRYRSESIRGECSPWWDRAEGKGDKAPRGQNKATVAAAGGVMLVALALLGLSLSRLATGVAIVTGLSERDGWLMAIGIDLGFVALDSPCLWHRPRSGLRWHAMPRLTSSMIYLAIGLGARLAAGSGLPSSGRPRTRSQPGHERDGRVPRPLTQRAHAGVRFQYEATFYRGVIALAPKAPTMALRSPLALAMWCRCNTEHCLAQAETCKLLTK
jgi:hypothetical protein